MIFKIHNRWNHSVKFEVEADSFVRAVEQKRANLSGANLSGANLSGANLSGADLRGANLRGANLRGANLSGANLFGASLSGADLFGASLRKASLFGASLYGADLFGANLSGANLSGANLSGANLRKADLSGASLREADLRGANLYGASLRKADLRGANLKNAKYLVKIMGVEPGNYYWKRFNAGLNNNGYQFCVGLNKLRDREVFASDDRATCSYPGFHFASHSWCAAYYSDRPLEAKIRIPEDAQINEPWATDGKASADMIEIIQVFDVATGEDVTDEYRRVK